MATPSHLSDSRAGKIHGPLPDRGVIIKSTADADMLEVRTEQDGIVPRTSDPRANDGASGFPSLKDGRVPVAGGVARGDHSVPRRFAFRVDMVEVMTVGHVPGVPLGGGIESGISSEWRPGVSRPVAVDQLQQQGLVWVRFPAPPFSPLRLFFLFPCFLPFFFATTSGLVRTVRARGAVRATMAAKNRRRPVCTHWSRVCPSDRSHVSCAIANSSHARCVMRAGHMAGQSTREPAN